MSADKKVIPFPQQLPAFVLELHSERMIDCLHALIAFGFKVTYIKDSVNRYRIDDEEPPACEPSTSTSNESSAGSRS